MDIFGVADAAERVNEAARAAAERIKQMGLANKIADAILQSDKFAVYEPTEDMIIAGMEAMPSATRADILRIWRAMINGAPTQ